MTTPPQEGRLHALVNECAAVVRARAVGFAPKVALILGSGLGDFADTLRDKVVIPYAELPHFPQSFCSNC